jgi:NAD(P)-dependent dehydrogenase (short-subunit alcohol dehydrogenase family)
MRISDQFHTFLHLSTQRRQPTLEMWRRQMTLADKVAILVGSGPNINAGIAYGLADAGAILVCVDVNPAYSEACAEAIVKRNGRAMAITANITSERDVELAVRATVGKYGKIDALVNGAAKQIRKGLLDVTLSEFRSQVDVGLDGTFLFTKYVAREMIARETRGSIVNIGSTEAYQGNIGNIAYGTVKAGLLNFTRCAAMELAEYGIRVNTVSPTGTDPSEGLARAAEWGVRWEQGVKQPERPDMTFGDQGIPLGRRPAPRHYAAGVVFLCSEAAEMITGTDLKIDGGVTGRYWRWNPGTRIQPL